MRGERTRKSGFTLIELLIVLAIIGIIGAISIPSMTRARLNARTKPFEQYFGIDVRPYVKDWRRDPAEWLTPEQKAILTPHTVRVMATVCADPTGELGKLQEARAALLAVAIPNNAFGVTARLQQLGALDLQIAQAQKIADAGQGSCREAREAAKQLGIPTE